MAENSSPRILLAPVEAQDGLALAELLIDAGLNVTTVSDRNELFLKLRSWEPEVVVAEVPHERDPESLAELIQGSSNHRVRVVLVCDRNPRRHMNARVLVKPFASEVVSAIVMSCLEP